MRLAVTASADLAVTRALVLRFAGAAGLDRRASAELALVASELASNMLKYAGAGEIELSTATDRVSVEARDRGPGPPSEAELFGDGISRGAVRLPDQSISTGRGTGGGTIRRLCDRVEVLARPGGGTIIRCHKHKPCPRSVRVPAKIAPR